MSRLLIVADDLSGAAETAGAVAAATGAVVDLAFDRVPPARADRMLAVDTGSRALTPVRAAEATLRAVRCRHPDALVYKKVDSQLRGNIATEVAALAAAGFALLAVLAAPRIARTVRDGVVRRDGVAGGAVGAALALRSIVIPLETVRSRHLERTIVGALASGAVPVLDGETEDDLRRVADVVAGLAQPPIVLAAGGLARPLAPRLGIPPASGRFERGADRVLVVAGTRDPAASGQVARLVAGGFRHLVLTPGAEPELDSGDTVLTLDAAANWEEASLDAALAAIGGAVTASGGRTDIVLTGGDTARRVLDAMGVAGMQVEIEIEDGAVLSTLESGSAVVTKPGSFGGEDSLHRITAFLKGELA